MPVLGQETPGANDASFNTADVEYGAGEGFKGFNDEAGALAVQADGKVLVGGRFSSFNGTPRNKIVRLNANGYLDASFDPGSGFNSTVNTVAVQSDGKVMAGGAFTTFNGITRNRIARLNIDGSLDSSFDPGIGFDSGVISLAVQSDGKVLVGGSFTSFNGTPRNRIARLNTDGTLDTSFDPGTGFDNIIRSVVLQSDGKLLIAGDFYTFNGIPRNRIARLNTDGSLDNSFDLGSGFDNRVNSLSMQSDGKVLAGGGFTSYNGSSQSSIVRLNTDGTLDASFNIGTTGFRAILSIAVQDDDKIVIGGYFTKKIARLNTDGSIDNSFDAGVGFEGISQNITNYISSITILSDNKILAVGGEIDSYNGLQVKNIACLNSDGTLDVGFNLSTGFNGTVLALAVQADGNVLAGGSFTSFNGTLRNRIARLNADGSLEASFDPGTGFSGVYDPDVFVTSLLLQPDGKIIIGGTFTSFNGTPISRVARLNTDGSLDSSFDPGSVIFDRVWALALQADGKILVGGQFMSNGGASPSGIARLNTDGTLDTSFNPGVGFNNTVRALAVQADGKVLAGGSFTSFDGTSCNRIVRLNIDGSLDTSFDTGSGISSGYGGVVNAIAVQPNGKVLAGGSYLSFNGSPRSPVVRLNTDGTLDKSLDPGSGFSNIVLSLAIQADGKVLVGGYVTSINGLVSTIARLNTDGTLDASFEAGSGPNHSVSSLALQGNDKVIIGGPFLSYNGIPRRRIARLNIGSLCPPIPSLTSLSTSTSDPIQINTDITATAFFSNYNLQSASWDWGDGSTSAGTISGSDVAGSHTYTATGVYTVTLTATDDCGEEATSSYEYVVVYDPDGGFVTGGGWIDSPAGAYARNPGLAGKASFGFVSKYKKGATVPTGNTSFEFKAADMHFSSTSYDWLVISGATARYKGEGTINGAGHYGFMLSAYDGQVNGDGADRLRLKIWDKNNDAVVYDNQMDDADDALASTEIGGGSIVVHKLKKASASSSLVSMEAQQAGFHVYPTAFSGRATVSFTLDQSEAYALEVYNVRGALVRRLATGTAEAGRRYEFEVSGEGLADGVYIVRLQTSFSVQSLKVVLRR